MHRVWISLGVIGGAAVAVPLATDHEVEAVADWFLYPAFAAPLTLAVLYGVLQPWWRTVFGISYMLILLTLVQMCGRALLTLWLGEDYPGRDWVLLAGRVELTFAAIAAIAMFIHYMVKDQRLLNGAEDQVSGPDSTFADQ